MSLLNEREDGSVSRFLLDFSAVMSQTISSFSLPYSETQFDVAVVMKLILPSAAKIVWFEVPPNLLLFSKTNIRT